MTQSMNVAADKHDPKTGAIRLATLRLFLPDGGCALSGLRSVRPAFYLASNPGGAAAYRG